MHTFFGTVFDAQLLPLIYIKFMDREYINDIVAFSLNALQLMYIYKKNWGHIINTNYSQSYKLFFAGKSYKLLTNKI
jgi:hypothetical protein